MHKNEITTGILVLFSGGIFFFFLIIVGMPGILKPLNSYRIYYDNASGIRLGAPVLLAGRVIGKVTALESPVLLENRPPGHPDYEVSIDVDVAREAQIYYNSTVRLTQQGLMGQPVIDFVHGDATSGLATNHAFFIGERIPDVSEAISKNMNQMMGPNSDLSGAIKNAKTFMETLNHSQISETLENTAAFTGILKREPWRLVWPGAIDNGVAKKGSERNKQHR